MAMHVTVIYVLSEISIYFESNNEKHCKPIGGHLLCLPLARDPIGWEVYCTLIHHDEMNNDEVQMFLLNNI